MQCQAKQRRAKKPKPTQSNATRSQTTQLNAKQSKANHYEATTSKAMHNKAAHYSTMQNKPMQCDVMRCRATQSKTVRSNALRCFGPLRFVLLRIWKLPQRIAKVCILHERGNALIQKLSFRLNETPPSAPQGKRPQQKLPFHIRAVTIERKS